MKSISAALLCAATLATLGGCASLPASGQSAQAVLQATQGNTVSGTVRFTQQGDQLLMEATIAGLSPGPHGFHIHEKGDCSAPDATSAGGHFNPGKTEHGDPAHGAHHGGDFGNLNADADGKAVLRLSVLTSQINLSKDQSNSILGKGLIVHGGADDFQTQPTGNSGKRVACGVITAQ